MKSSSALGKPSPIRAPFPRADLTPLVSPDKTPTSATIRNEGRFAQVEASSLRSPLSIMSPSVVASPPLTSPSPSKTPVASTPTGFEAFSTSTTPKAVAEPDAPTVDAPFPSMSMFMFLQRKRATEMSLASSAPAAAPEPSTPTAPASPSPISSGSPVAAKQQFRTTLGKAAVSLLAPSLTPPRRPEAPKTQFSLPTRGSRPLATAAVPVVPVVPVVGSPLTTATTPKATKRRLYKPEEMGAATSAVNGTEDVLVHNDFHFSDETAFRSVGAVSWRGRNPSGAKINQDAALIAEHRATNSLVVGIFDGHGQNGREVAQYFADNYMDVLTSDPKFAPSVLTAVAEHEKAPTALKWESKTNATEERRQAIKTFMRAVSPPAPRRSLSRTLPASKTGAATGAAALQVVCDIMGDALQACENIMLSSAGIDCSLSGATAVVALISGPCLFTINVGDSRAVLGCSERPMVEFELASLMGGWASSSAEGSLAPGAAIIGMPYRPDPTSPSGSVSYAHLRAAALAAEPSYSRPSVRSKMLTYDHKPEIPKERQRIMAGGGRVATSAGKGPASVIGPHRVWLKTAPLPGLNMSRSVGDLIGKQAGVISVPHKTHHIIQPEEKVLILASDGLWDWIPNDEAAALALSTLSCVEAAHRLARMSRSRWLSRTGSADDTSIVVVRLGPAKKIESGS